MHSLPPTSPRRTGCFFRSAAVFRLWQCLKNLAKQQGAVISTEPRINDRIRSVLEINHLLYLFGADFLWIFNPTTNQISKSIRTHEYQWMTSIGPKIYFFEPYNNICIFNTKTDKLARETSIEAKSDGVISQKNYIIFHKFGKGFGCIDANENYHDFTCDKPLISTLYNFKFLENNY